MVETFWNDSNEDIAVNSSGEPCDCSHDPCGSVCVGDINFIYVCRTSFTFNGVATTNTLSLIYDQDFGGEIFGGIYTRDTWSGSANCSGHNYTVRVYCRNDAWFFDLITGGVNYANPAIPDTHGGATLISSSPVHVFGEITTGYYAEQFPFCGKTSSAPSGDFLNDFHFNMTES